MWRTLTQSDIEARLNTVELENYQLAGEPAAQDRLTRILEQVTAQVRGYVAKWPDNRAAMGEQGTIPDELAFAASTIARQALVGSQPTAEGMSDERREELRRAYADLDAAANGKLYVQPAGQGSNAGAFGSTGGAYGGDPFYRF